MFKDLRAGTKFLILCGVCLVLTSVATYALLVEKQIAINFARSELVGSKYLALLRPIFVAVLKTETNAQLADPNNALASESVASLSRADTETAGILHIEDPVKALAATLRDLNANTTAGIPTGEAYLAALKNLRELAARIGDDSKLTLDPVLDTYHVGNIVVTRLPTALEELGNAQLLTRTPQAANDPVDRKARLIALDTLLRANMNGVTNDLRAAQRGNPDGRLRQLVDPAITSLAMDTSAYLDTLRTFVDSGADNAKPDASYAGAVNGALGAWDIAQKQLDQLLLERIDDLNRQRLISLIVIGVLGMLGLLIALLTYRDMIVPIKRLAELANTIRETKNYGLRFNYESRDEIGRLAGAFNEMLGELSVAREREIMS